MKKTAPSHHNDRNGPVGIGENQRPLASRDRRHYKASVCASRVGDNPTSLNDPSGLQSREAGENCTMENMGSSGCAGGPGVTDTGARVLPGEKGLSRLMQGLKGGGEVVLGIGLIATTAGGDVPGGVAGIILVANAGVTGTVIFAKGTVDVAGAATNTDVSKGDQALEATGNLGGLAATAASRGNLKVGEAASTLTNTGALAANPMEAGRNVATGVEALRTVVGAYDLVRSVMNTLSTEGKSALPPLLF